MKGVRSGTVLAISILAVLALSLTIFGSVATVSADTGQGPGSRQVARISLISSETRLATEINTPEIHTVGLGNSTVFSVVIMNVGSYSGSYNIQLNSDNNFPNSWTSRSDAGYSIQLDQGNSRVFHVTLTAPTSTSRPGYTDEATLKVQATPYDDCGCEDTSDVKLDLQGRNKDAAQLTNSVSMTAIIRNGLNPPLVHVIGPGQTTSFLTECLNDGSTPVHVGFSPSFPVGTMINWNSAVNPAQANIIGNDRKSVVLNVSSPLDAMSGDYVKYIIQAVEDSGVHDEITTYTIIQRLQGVDVSPPDSTRYILPGRPVVFDLDILNTGTARDSFAITVSGAKAGWGMSLSLTYVELDSMANASFNLTVTPPPGAGPDEVWGNFTVTGTSNADSTKSDHAICRVKTNLTFFIQIETIELTKYVYPGETVQFPLLVSNYGNVRDTALIGFEQSDGRNWTPRISSSFSDNLTVDESRVVYLNVTAPSLDMLDRNSHMEAGFRFHVAVWAYSSHSNETVSHILTTTIMLPVHNISAGGSPPLITTPSGQSVLFDVNVTNLGNSLENHTLKATVLDKTNASMSSWIAAFAFGADTVSILPTPYLIDFSMKLRVTVPGGTLPGDYPVKVEAANSAGQVALVNLTVRVLETLAVDVSIIPAQQNVSSGDNVTFEVTVTNMGNRGDSYDISLVNVSGHVEWDRILLLNVPFLEPFRSARGTLTVYVPEGANASDKLVLSLKAVSRTDSSVTDSAGATTIVNPTHNLIARLVPPVIEGYPGQSVNTTLIVTNRGNSLEKTRINLRDIDSRFSGKIMYEGAELDRTLEITKGMSLYFNVTFIIPANELVGNHSFNCTANYLGGVAPTSGLLRVRQLFNVSIAIHPESISLLPGQATEYTVIVSNMGNGRDVLGVNRTRDAEQYGWAILDLGNMTLDPFSGTNFALKVTVPEGVHGGSYKYELKVISNGAVLEGLERSGVASCLLEIQGTTSFVGTCAAIGIAVFLAILTAAIVGYLYKKMVRDKRASEDLDQMEEFQIVDSPVDGQEPPKIQ